MNTNIWNRHPVFFAVILTTFGISGLVSAKSQSTGFPKLSWSIKVDYSKKDLGLPHLSDVETYTLYYATKKTGAYNHHSYITFFKGAFFTIWSNGKKDEDAPGQRVYGSRSTDGGKTWTRFTIVFPPADHVAPASDAGPKRRILTADGFAVVNNTLYAVAAVTHPGQHGMGRVARSLGPGGFLGPIFWLRRHPPMPITGFPAYPTEGDARFTEIANEINRYLADPMHLPTWDFWHKSTRRLALDGHLLCEPTYAWRLPGGDLARIWRDLGGSHREYISYRLVHGRHWSYPEKTNWPDANSRSSAGNLPNGTAYVVNNPRPGNVNGFSARDPLVISLANSGVIFKRAAIIRVSGPPRRFAGRWKNRGFQYPSSVVVGKNLWVMYSVNKEDVQVSKIPIASINAISNANS